MRRCTHFLNGVVEGVFDRRAVPLVHLHGFILRKETETKTSVLVSVLVVLKKRINIINHLLKLFLI